MKNPSRLAFGTASLSRLECGTCKETTLHRYNKCIHCGAEQTSTPVRSIDRWNSNNGPTARRS